jgi:ABC-type Fe3+ transport system permease subunit
LFKPNLPELTYIGLAHNPAADAGALYIPALQGGQMIETRDAPLSQRRSWLGWIAIVATVVSAVGLVVLLVGDIAGAEGAEEGEEGSIIFDIAWVSFFFGGCIALLSGVAAFLVGRMRADARTRRDGTIALVYCAVAAVAAIIGASI